MTDVEVIVSTFPVVSLTQFEVWDVFRRFCFFFLFRFPKSRAAHFPVLALLCMLLNFRNYMTLTSRLHSQPANILAEWMSSGWKFSNKFAHFVCVAFARWRHWRQLSCTVPVPDIQMYALNAVLMFLCLFIRSFIGLFTFQSCWVWRASEDSHRVRCAINKPSFKWFFPTPKTYWTQLICLAKVFEINSAICKCWQERRLEFWTENC